VGTTKLNVIRFDSGRRVIKLAILLARKTGRERDMERGWNRETGI